MDVGNVISTFLDKGILGAIIVVLGAVVAFQYRENRDLNEKRIGDLTQTRDILIEPLQRLQKTSDTLIEKSEQMSSILLNFLSKKQ